MGACQEGLQYDIYKVMAVATNQSQAASPAKEDPMLQEMLKAGVYFGHRTSRTHPKMLPHISGIRNTVHIIDLVKTKEKLESALQIISRLVSEGKVILFVGTKVQVRNIVKETAEAVDMPYVAERWIGGLFTNFDTLAKRIEKLKELEQAKEKGEWAKYTKQEQARLNLAARDLQEKFGGIRSLVKLPDALFVCDINKEHTAIREAKRKGIPIIAIADTNTDPTSVDYPIPANDDAISSVQYILGKIKTVILETKSQAPTTSSV